MESNGIILEDKMETKKHVVDFRRDLFLTSQFATDVSKAFVEPPK